MMIPTQGVRIKNRPIANRSIGHGSALLKSRHAKYRPQTKSQHAHMRARARTFKYSKSLPLAYVGRKASFPWSTSFLLPPTVCSRSFHLATVEAHCGIVAQRERKSMALCGRQKRRNGAAEGRRWQISIAGSGLSSFCCLVCQGSTICA